MFRYSLRSLFVVVTIAAAASWVTYLVMRPYWVLSRIDCGNGRWVELLEPNEFCDQGGPVHFRYSGFKGAEPPSFAMWGCGSRPPGKLISAENGDLVAVFTFWPDQLDVL